MSELEQAVTEKVGVFADICQRIQDSLVNNRHVPECEIEIARSIMYSTTHAIARILDFERCELELYHQLYKNPEKTYEVLNVTPDEIIAKGANRNIALRNSSALKTWISGKIFETTRAIKWYEKLPKLLLDSIHELEDYANGNITNM